MTQSKHINALRISPTSGLFRCSTMKPCPHLHVRSALVTHKQSQRPISDRRTGAHTAWTAAERRCCALRSIPTIIGLRLRSTHVRGGGGHAKWTNSATNHYPPFRDPHSEAGPGLLFHRQRGAPDPHSIEGRAVKRRVTPLLRSGRPGLGREEGTSTGGGLVHWCSVVGDGSPSGVPRGSNCVSSITLHLHHS